MQQIADWLKKLGISEYAERFAGDDIDASGLRSCAILTAAVHARRSDLLVAGVDSLALRRPRANGVRVSGGRSENLQGRKPPPMSEGSQDSATGGPGAGHCRPGRCKFTREVMMRKNLLVSSTMVFVLTLAVGTAQDAMAQQAKPIRIGVNTAIQLQVGRDSMDGVKMAIDELNEQGGVLERKFEMITADEGEAATEGPKLGIAALMREKAAQPVPNVFRGASVPPAEAETWLESIRAAFGLAEERNK